MIVITQFKNVTPTFFTFINFYKAVWNCTEFIFLIGYNDNSNYEFITHTYMNEYQILKKKKYQSVDVFHDIEAYEGVLENVSCKIMLYKIHTNVNFEPRRPIVDKLCLNIFGFSNDVTFWIDDDEFYYINDPEIVKKSDKYRFHFVEIVPTQTNFDKEKLTWCPQGWYIHRYHQKKDFDCRACKTLFPHKSGRTWSHSRDTCFENSSCEYFSKTKCIDDKLFQKGVCFHFTAMTVEQFKSIKLSNRYPSGYGNYKYTLVTGENAIELYGTFNSNVLSPYIDDRDITQLTRAEGTNGP